MIVPGCLHDDFFSICISVLIHTSFLPAGLGAPQALETLQGNGWARWNIAREPPGTPSQVTATHVFSAQKGVCPALPTTLHPFWRSSTLLSTGFPAQANECHARFSILRRSTAGVPRIFGTTNYGAPTRHKHSTRTASGLLRPNPGTD